MAVFRRRDEATPSGDAPPGVVPPNNQANSKQDGASNGSAGTPVGGNAAAPVDRTRSALSARNTAASAASRAPLERSAPRGMAARPGVARPGVGGPQVAQPSNVRALITDTIAELKRVVWPTRAEVMAGTIVTVMLLIFFSLYIFGLDYAAQWLFYAMGLYSGAPGSGNP